jgi:hypothetical protein
VQKPIVTLEFGGSVGNDRRRHLRDELGRVLSEIEPGTECIDEIITDLQPTVDTVTTQQSNATNALNSRQQSSTQNLDIVQQDNKLVLIWTHHLLSTQKRKFIRDRSNAIGLVGYSKPGYPGVIVIEGAASDVDLFVQELKELRWQALSVKAEVSHSRRQLGSITGVREIESISDLTKELSKDGLEEWFLDAIGLRKSDAA